MNNQRNRDINLLFTTLNIRKVKKFYKLFNSFQCQPFLFIFFFIAISFRFLFVLLTWWLLFVVVCICVLLFLLSLLYFRKSEKLINDISRLTNANASIINSVKSYKSPRRKKQTTTTYRHTKCFSFTPFSANC